MIEDSVVLEIEASMSLGTSGLRSRNQYMNPSLAKGIENQGYSILRLLACARVTENRADKGDERGQALQPTLARISKLLLSHGIHGY